MIARRAASICRAVTRAGVVAFRPKAPKFSAYLASKTALDTWSRIAGRETYGDGVTFTNRPNIRSAAA